MSLSQHTSNMRSAATLGLLACVVGCDDAPLAADIQLIRAAGCEGVSCGGVGLCAVDRDGAPACVCDVGYAGEGCSLCEAGFHRDAQDRCAPDRLCADQPEDPCAPRGSCVDLDGVIACRCDDDYDGPRCNLCAGDLVHLDSDQCGPRPRTGVVPVTPSDAGLFRPGLDASTGTSDDAGAADAGQPDAGATDASAPDAGTADAGAPDAGAPDAGTPDAGTPDAGTCASERIAQDFNTLPGWPELANTCTSRTSLETPSWNIRSRAGNGLVQLCAPSSFNNFSTRYVELEASASEPAEIRFAAPVRSAEFAYTATLQPVSVEVLGDGVVLQALEVARRAGSSLRLSFATPIRTLAFRSPNAYTQKLGVDDLTVETAVCR
jgi:hypothetical protein